jgi:hypothetical protein
VLGIVKAARSTAFEAAESWVTMSSQSRPASIIARTPSICPRARRSRVATAAADSSSICMTDSCGIVSVAITKP